MQCNESIGYGGLDKDHKDLNRKDCKHGLYELWRHFPGHIVDTETILPILLVILSMLQMWLDLPELMTDLAHIFLEYAFRHFNISATH